MAAKSSPAVLPISNAQPAVATGENQTLLPSSASNTTARAFFVGILESVRYGLVNRRPWMELVDRSAFSKPDSVSEATVRLRKNCTYFRTNYFTIVTAVIAISLITNPFSLILLAALLAAWIFLYLFRHSSDGPLVIFGRQFTELETLASLIASTIVVFFLTSVGSVIISALMFGVGFVCIHGAFRDPDDLFLDQPEPQGGLPGFLALLYGGVPASPQPPVPPRA